MIEIKNLTKEYDGKKIVDSLNLSVQKGTIFGFLGPNGAGKTTTIKMIVGLSKPTSGTIKLEDRNVDKSLIGYMPEDPYFYDRLTAAEFLEFMFELSSNKKFPWEVVRGKDWDARDKGRPSKRSPLSLAKDDQGYINQLLAKVGLLNVEKTPIGNFSKGMKQRLGLAQAIINDPEYLFLDEPLDGLDPIGRLEFKKIIMGLKKQGKTIFLNSHVLSDVEEICDEIGILDKGKLVYSGSVKKFCGQDPLEKKFVEVIGQHASKSANQQTSEKRC